MGKRQFHLSEDEIKALRQAEQQTRNVCELRHFQGVRLYGSGVAREQIFDLLGCGASTLHEWVQKYQRSGIEGLRNGWDGQNANKLTDDQRAELKRRLHQAAPDQALPPDQRTSSGPFWTVAALRLAVQWWYGVGYKDDGSLRHLFRRCGFSYHKVEAVYKSQPSQANIVDFESRLEKK